MDFNVEQGQIFVVSREKIKIKIKTKELKEERNYVEIKSKSILKKLQFQAKNVTSVVDQTGEKSYEHFVTNT